MRRTLLSALALLLLAGATVIAQETREVTFTWYGQGCFLVETSSGTQILLDPVKMDAYAVPAEAKPDMVTVSHNHFDHNQVESVSCEPVVLYGKTREEDDPFQKIIPVDTTISGVHIYNVSSSHHPAETSPSLNAIFVFEFDGLRLVHLGDLGRTLSEDQIAKIGRVDILMIPVGGKYTIFGPTADSVVTQLQPTQIVFPMHYRTRVADFLPYSADDFVVGKTGVVRFAGNSFTYDANQPFTDLNYILFDCFKDDTATTE